MAELSCIFMCLTLIADKGLNSILIQQNWLYARSTQLALVSREGYS